MLYEAVRGSISFVASVITTNEGKTAMVAARIDYYYTPVYYLFAASQYTQGDVQG